MKIKNHLLYDNAGKQVRYVATPNHGSAYAPQYLVMHYTAATTTDSAVSWLSNRIAQASAHLVIGRDGAVTQMAPFNVITWHAGKSRWNGLEGLNQYAIGIELVNAGRLSKIGERYICPVDKQFIGSDDVIIARHKNEQEESAWQEYTSRQLDAALEISALLVTTYGLKDVIGHDDIAPIRKSDPGPAFPMKSFRSRAMGRHDETQDEYLTSATVNIRKGPSTLDAPITTLPADTHVTVLNMQGNWSFVEVTNPVHDIMDLEGWVFSKYLVRA